MGGLDRDEFMRHMQERRAMRPVIDKIESPAQSWDRFAALRKLYAEGGEETNYVYPYGIDWYQVFTPIEFHLWCELRCNRFRVKPQYPVGRYFLDFALPEYRIGIEADGKEWHDHEKDGRRDSELWRMGWRVFRLEGHECNRVIDPDFEDVAYRIREYGRATEEFETWKYKTIDGFITALVVILEARDFNCVTQDEAYKILHVHRHADFPLEFPCYEQSKSTGLDY